MSEEISNIAVMDKPVEVAPATVAVEIPHEQKVVPYEKTGEYFVEQIGDSNNCGFDQNKFARSGILSSGKARIKRQKN